MPQHPFSKCSIASRAAKAADHDQQESQLQQAAAKLGNGQHDSLCKAARANNVPKSTLRHWMEGQPPKKGAQATQQSLTPTAETALLKHIWHCACSRYPLMTALLCEYTATIIHPVPGHNQQSEVTHNWMQSFLLSHPAIWTHWSCCLDNSCITGANETII